jgi:predicted amidohydrolase
MAAPALLAVAQMRSCRDAQSNLDMAERLVARAKERGARLVCLPENCAMFGAEAKGEAVAGRPPRDAR